jgi:hypothetical protein
MCVASAFVFSSIVVDALQACIEVIVGRWQLIDAYARQVARCRTIATSTSKFVDEVLIVALRAF